MRKNIYAALAVALAAAQASALEVSSTAGALPSLIEAPSAVSELKITGTVDASDLYFVGREMTSLRRLDLSEVQIAAYSGDKIGGATTHAASTIPQGAFMATGLTSVLLPESGRVAIGDFAFADSRLETVTVSAGVASIGQAAFANCDELTEVTLRPVETGTYAFKGCDKLQTVHLGGMTKIGASDFADCPVLTTVEGTSSLVSVGAASFEGCSSLESFDFPAGLTTIGGSAFSRSGLVSADLSACSRLSDVGAWAFAYTPSLVSVTLPDGLSEIGDGAFFDCPVLATVNIPESCQFVPDYAFKGNTALIDVAVPEGIYELGRYAYHGASSLSTVTLPSSMEYIGDRAMANATSLKTVDAGELDYVPELGEEVWDGVEQANVRLVVKPDMVGAYEAADQWQNFEIRGISTGADNIVAEVDASSLRARFSGYMLEVEVSGVTIASLQLYDTAGAQLASLNVDAERVAVDTSHLSTSVYIVSCTLSDSSSATVKIARK